MEADGSFSLIFPGNLKKETPLAKAGFLFLSFTT
jgi:hypothetical protein